MTGENGKGVTVLTFRFLVRLNILPNCHLCPFYAFLLLSLSLLDVSLLIY